MNDTTTRRLDRGWTIDLMGPNPHAPSDLPAAIPAAVPGVVHQALIAAGVEVDANLRDGEAAQRWVGRSDWVWRRRLEAGDLPSGTGHDDLIELEFDSIDTVGCIRLGDRLVADVDNQFHPHRIRIPVAEIHDGLELAVELRSPMRALESSVVNHGERPVNADGEWGIYSYLRKAACSFGWDWGPQCPSLGLVGEVRLRRWRDARIQAVRPLVAMCETDAAVVEIEVDVEIDVETAGEGPLQIEAMLEGPDGRRWVVRESVLDGRGRLRIDVSAPQRWWPRGHGEPHLHDLVVTLHRADEPIDVASRRIGLRRVEIDRTPDDTGESFRFVVNGRSIRCLGANWIPDGLYPGTATATRTRARIEQAVAANFNMLRVWGGGVYESDAFYERCDELGVMVWQDFMFACATYPEHSAFLESVQREVRHQVSRLSCHASVVVWCGGNENVLAYRNWGWKERMPADQAWGRRIFTELLPSLVSELDPSRPYLPDSPWSGTVDADPNDPDRGDRHTWDLKLEGILEMVPRFLSEFGHQSPPMRDTIEAAIGAEALSSEAPDAMVAFESRQRGWGGDAAQYDRWLEDWFLPASDLDQRLWSMHLLQARAMTLTYEWLRLNRSRCGGVLVWQLNDAWAGHSWSLIDVAGRCKPSWWAAKRACRPTLLAFAAGDEGLRIGVDNEGDERFVEPVIVRRLRFDGVDVAAVSLSQDVSPWSTSMTSIPVAVTATDQPSNEFLLATSGGERAFWFYGKDAWLDLPVPRVRITILESPDEPPRISVEALRLVRDLFVEIRGTTPSAHVENNLVTLLPGEHWSSQVLGLHGIEGRSPTAAWWIERLHITASGPSAVEVVALEVRGT